MASQNVSKERAVDPIDERCGNECPSSCKLVMKQPILVTIFRIIVLANENCKGGPRLYRGGLGDRHLVMLLLSSVFSNDYCFKCYSGAAQGLQSVEHNDNSKRQVHHAMITTLGYSRCIVKSPYTTGNRMSRRCF